MNKRYATVNQKYTVRKLCVKNNVRKLYARMLNCVKNNVRELCMLRLALERAGMLRITIRKLYVKNNIRKLCVKNNIRKLYVC